MSTVAVNAGTGTGLDAVESNSLSPLQCAIIGAVVADAWSFVTTATSAFRVWPSSRCEETARSGAGESDEVEAAERAVGNAITAARQDGVKYLFVEGFLITTQPRIMAILDHLIYLHVSPEASQVLLMRKWTRSHFNKTSYQDKGVSLADFTCFWEGYVFARYQQHIPKTFPENTITIDCMLPTNDAVAAIRAQLPRASD